MKLTSVPQILLQKLLVELKSVVLWSSGFCSPFPYTGFLIFVKSSAKNGLPICSKVCSYCNCISQVCLIRAADYNNQRVRWKLKRHQKNNVSPSSFSLFTMKGHGLSCVVDLLLVVHVSQPACLPRRKVMSEVDVPIIRTASTCTRCKPNYHSDWKKWKTGTHIHTHL